MEKEQRNLLRRAVERARRLLEQEVAEQLEGTYNILPDGRALDHAPGDPNVRARLLDIVAHHRAGGASAKEAVERLRRELAFATLNRFAALKMAERRGLVRECIANGIESTGIRELADCAPGLRSALDDGGYRLLLEAVMDEVSLGLKVLFDRRSPTGLIWPRPNALEELLQVLNAPELEKLWEEDETIGWVYQYFNSQEERREMRESAAPRNSRELAVRNQFFTPRYVVSFLTDNTLGRLWYEVRAGDTRLKEQCEYLVYQPNEIFLSEGEEAPDATAQADRIATGSSDKGVAYIRYRVKKDPRDLKILDPACGSGHFLLYCFDLLQTIYEEAWADEQSPPSEATGRALREDYRTLDRLRREVPGLILQYNLYGIDIDARAVQIAALALWMRAQRAYNELEVKPAERPEISRTNVVVAEPMPGERELLEELTQTLQPRLLGQVVEKSFEHMRLAGEAGSLLKIEREIQITLDKAKKAWLKSPRQEQLSLLPEQPSPQQASLDLTGITDEAFWQEAEARIYEALEHHAKSAANGKAYRRALFANDTVHGFAFIDVCRRRYDVVLMNPPFGAASQRSKKYIERAYPRTKNDLYAAFVERGIQWLQPHGMLGAITSRTGFFLTSFRRWREEVALGEARPTVVADLGYGVLDTAMVETAAYVLEANG